jgi:gas vesicle protein
MAYRYDEYGDVYGYENSSGMNKLLTGLLVGALVGGLVMLFLAPDSGKKTLNKLRKKTKKLRHEAFEAVDDRMKDARHTLSKASAGVRKQVKAVKGRTEDLYDEQRERVAEAVETGRKRLRVR